MGGATPLEKVLTGTAMVSPARVNSQACLQKSGVLKEVMGADLICVDGEE